MGSSTKKHKSEKKKKRSRSPEKSKERHRHHRKHHKDRKRKIEVIDVDAEDSSSSEVEEVDVLVPPPPKISKRVTPPPPPVISAESSDSKTHESLSIEETNKLRAKLGLKPLQVESATPVKPDDDAPKKDTMGGVDMGEFVYKPATNFAEKARSEKIKQRLQERKDKREIEKKLKSTKLLAEDSDEGDDTKSWVVKSRQKEIEKKKAEHRAKMLEELDNEFGIGALVAEDIRKEKNQSYTSRNLKGLRVEHSLEGFEEGRQVILTLKDKAVLDEEDDVLVNVNMVDDERHKKNLDRRKLKPGVSNFDDEVEGSSNVLSKYDEEIDGVKNDCFALGDEEAKLRKIKQKLEVKQKLKLNKLLISLDTTNVRLASDYYTEAEMDAKFKKPTKKVRKIRKKPKMLKADDIMPLQEMMYPSEDLGSRSGRLKSRHVDKDESVAMDIVKNEPLEDVLDVDDVQIPDVDLTDVKLEPDESELELQLALNKARKLKQKELTESSVEKLAKEFSHNADSMNQDAAGGSIVLNSTAEFCRTLGDIPTYGLAGNREEDGQELLDFEKEMKEEKQKYEAEKNYRGTWHQIEIADDTPVEIIPVEVPILDVEPDVSSGMAGALRLAVSKGYLEKETSNRPSASRIAHLQAQNYSIEDKAHGDDDKFGRRERYAGPTTDFKEKDNYKPNVSLEYIDDDGHILSSKEAFRYLSHKFHGKGPGKNKVEKRMKKQEQEGLMKQMSSTDTPLRTLTMLQQKQKETQSPFVVLSGNKIASATIIKSKHL